MFSLFLEKRTLELQPLAEKITTLLMKYPGSRVAKFAFPEIFLREYDQVLKPKDWGYSNMDALIRALGDVIEVSNNLFSPYIYLRGCVMASFTFLITAELKL